MAREEFLCRLPRSKTKLVDFPNGASSGALPCQIVLQAFPAGLARQSTASCLREQIGELLAAVLTSPAQLLESVQLHGAAAGDPPALPLFQTG
jgi:hypothetical protein